MLKFTKILTILIGAALVLASCSNNALTDLAKNGDGGGGDHYVIKGLFAPKKDACIIDGLSFANGGFASTHDEKKADIGDDGKMKITEMPTGDYDLVTCTGLYTNEITGAISKEAITLKGFFRKADGINNINAFTDVIAEPLQKELAKQLVANPKDADDTLSKIKAVVSKSIAKEMHVREQADIDKITDVSLLNSADPNSVGDIALLIASVNVLSNNAVSGGKISIAAEFKADGTIKEGSIDPMPNKLSGKNLVYISKVMKTANVDPSKFNGIGDIVKAKYEDISETVGLINRAGTVIQGVTIENGRVTLPAGTTEAMLPMSPKDPANSIYYTLDDGVNWIELASSADSDKRNLFAPTEEPGKDPLTSFKTVIIVEGVSGTKPAEGTADPNIITEDVPDGFTPRGYFNLNIQPPPVATLKYSDISESVPLTDKADTPLKPVSLNDGLVLLASNADEIVLQTRPTDTTKNSIYYTLDDGNTWTELANDADDDARNLFATSASAGKDSFATAKTIVIMEGVSGTKPTEGTANPDILTTKLPDGFTPMGYFKLQVAHAEGDLLLTEYPDAVIPADATQMDMAGVKFAITDAGGRHKRFDTRPANLGGMIDVDHGHVTIYANDDSRIQIEDQVPAGATKLYRVYGRAKAAPCPVYASGDPSTPNFPYYINPATVKAFPDQSVLVGFCKAAALTDIAATEDDPCHAVDGKTVTTIAKFKLTVKTPPALPAIVLSSASRLDGKDITKSVTVKNGTTPINLNIVSGDAKNPIANAKYFVAGQPRASALPITLGQDTDISSLFEGDDTLSTFTVCMLKPAGTFNDCTTSATATGNVIAVATFTATKEGAPLMELTWSDGTGIKDMLGSFTPHLPDRKSAVMDMAGPPRDTWLFISNNTGWQIATFGGDVGFIMTTDASGTIKRIAANIPNNDKRVHFDWKELTPQHKGGDVHLVLCVVRDTTTATDCESAKPGERATITVHTK